MVGTQIVLVEAVEDLMIGVKRGADRRVAETFVQSEVDRGEKRAFGSLTGGLHQFAEDVAQTLLLFLAVGQDESALTVGEIFDKGVQHLLKVLVEQGLRLRVETTVGTFSLPVADFVPEPRTHCQKMLPSNCACNSFPLTNRREAAKRA